MLRYSVVFGFEASRAAFNNLDLVVSYIKLDIRRRCRLTDLWYLLPWILRFLQNIRWRFYYASALTYANNISQGSMKSLAWVIDYKHI